MGPYLILFFAMKTSLHNLILFFCNEDFIARPDSFFVMVLPFRPCLARDITTRIIGQ